VEEFGQLLVPPPFTSQGLFVINIWLKSRSWQKNLASHKYNIVKGITIGSAFSTKPRYSSFN